MNGIELNWQNPISTTTTQQREKDDINHYFTLKVYYRFGKTIWFFLPMYDICEFFLNFECFLLAQLLLMMDNYHFFWNVGGLCCLLSLPPPEKNCLLKIAHKSAHLRYLFYLMKYLVIYMMWWWWWPLHWIHQTKITIFERKTIIIFRCL